MKTTSKINHDKISDQVYAIVRDRIINNKLKPGTRLDLSELEEELKVSKTPLREALTRLQMEQLVEIKPRSGTYVAIPHLKDIIDVFDLRKAIEGQAVELAVEHIPGLILHELEEEILQAEKLLMKGDYGHFFKSDIRLHQEIFYNSKNSRLLKVKEMIDNYLHWLRTASVTKERAQESTNRHKELIQSLLERDAKQSRSIMEKHIDEVKLIMIEEYSDHKGGF